MTLLCLLDQLEVLQVSLPSSHLQKGQWCGGDHTWLFHRGCTNEQSPREPGSRGPWSWGGQDALRAWSVFASSRPGDFLPAMDGLDPAAPSEGTADAPRWEPPRPWEGEKYDIPL